MEVFGLNFNLIKLVSVTISMYLNEINDKLIMFYIFDFPWEQLLWMNPVKWEDWKDIMHLISHLEMNLFFFLKLYFNDFSNFMWLLFIYLNAISMLLYSYPCVTIISAIFCIYFITFTYYLLDTFLINYVAKKKNYILIRRVLW